MLLKDRMGLKIKNVNILGVHQFLGEGRHKKTIHMENCQKNRGLGQFAGGLLKNREEGVFEGGGGWLIPRCAL